MVYELQPPVFSHEENTEEIITSKKSQSNWLKFYLNILKRRWLIVVISSISGLIPMILWTRNDPMIYGGSFQLLVEPVSSAQKLTDPTLLTRSGGNTRNSNDLFAVDYPTIINILQKNSLSLEIIDELAQRHQGVTPSSLASDLRENLVIERVRTGAGRFDETKIIEVKFQGENDKLVLDVLETLADEFIKYSQEEREKNLTGGLNFINEQIPTIRQRIDKLQEQQKKLQTQYELIEPQEKGSYVFEVTNTREQEIINTESQLRELQSKASNLQEDLGFSSSDALIASTLSQDPERQALVVKLLETDSQIALESAKLTENHPTLLNLREQRDNIDSLIQRETDRIFMKNNIDPTTVNPRVLAYQDTQRQALIQELITIQNDIDSLTVRYQSLTANQVKNNQDLATIPEVIKQYKDLTRQVELDTAILNQLTSQRETLAVEVSEKQVPWQIITPPTLPRDQFGEIIGSPPSPLKKWAAGFTGGFLLGTLGAIAFEKRKDVVFEESDLEYAFNLPVLGTIIVGRKYLIKRQLADTNFFGTAIAEKNTKDDDIKISQQSLSEIYTNLHFSLPYPNRNYIMIFSLDAKEEQGYLVANLARTAAEIDQRVLLIDATPEGKEIDQYFPKPVHKGLDNLINFAEDSREDDTYQENVAILTAGRKDSDLPSLSRGSLETQYLIEKISSEYSLTIYNGGSFLESYDMNLFAKKTQGIVLLIKLDQTSLSQISEAVKRIERYQLNFLGFILMG